MTDEEHGETRLASIAAPWRAALQEGWVAFCAGDPPVGAAISDPDGAIVAVARNRRHEDEGPPGQLAGTGLAHAEVNALAQLGPGGHPGHTLWATLQPCPLCAAAAMIAGCGEVRFLAADPLWSGAERLPEVSPAVAARWPRFHGPQPGWPASWQTMLSVAFQTARGHGADPVVTGRAAVAPQATRAGLRLGGDPAELARLTELPLAAALDRIAPSMETESGPTS